MPVLKLQIRYVHGHKLIYPIGQQALLLTKLLCRKTFVSADLTVLLEMGYTFEYIPQDI